MSVNIERARDALVTLLNSVVAPDVPVSEQERIDYQNDIMESFCRAIIEEIRDNAVVNTSGLNVRSNQEPFGIIGTVDSDTNIV